MPCPTPELVLDYVAKRLAGPARDAVDLHLDGCPACRILIGELARTELADVIELARVDDPAQIGRYEIAGRIAEGGMGTVYAAHDPQLDRKVAVKLVHPELAKQGGLERLLREGRALARLSHPHVVAVYDAGLDGDKLYVAMELVEGETLAAWLAGGPRGWREIVDKFIAAGHGIAAAHRAGIVHRDVKPENVMLDRDGRPKVADFGLAGRVDPDVAAAAPEPGAVADPASRLTQPGTVMGTPMFMSPEQRRGGEVGPATDQYSLCAALAQALAGATHDRQLRAVPRWLRRAIDRGRAADPAARFRSIDELIAALDPARHARRARRFGLALAGVAAIAAGLVWTGPPRRAATAVACDDADAARATGWTPRDRFLLAAGLAGAPVGYAADTWMRVDAAITSYHAELATAQAGLCTEAPRTTEARDRLDQGLACLADRRDALAGLVDRLRQVHPADVRLSVALVHDLPSVGDCADPVTLEAERRARATPAGLMARTGVALAIRAAREANAAGRYREAADQAEHAVALARPLGGVILVQALLALVDNATLVEGFPATEAAAREAATIAETVHADELRAAALANLMRAMARESGREREALAFGPLVEAAIARIGQRSVLTATVQQARGSAQLRLGQYEAAIQSYRDALATARAMLPRDDPRMPEYLYPVGVALGMLGHDEEAVTFHAEAYRVATDVWGASHPNTARFAINLACKHAALGHCDVALDELARARAVLSGALAPDSIEHLAIDQAMGGCYYIQHRYDDALREYTGRQRALVDAGRTHSTEMAASWVDVGDVQFDRKQYDAAATSYQRTVAMYEELVGTTDARLGLPLSRLGEALLGAHQTAGAIVVLERSLAIYAAAKVPAIVSANAAFPLARALWERPADRTRAISLARSARDAWAGGGPFNVERKTAADAWLRAHGAS